MVKKMKDDFNVSSEVRYNLQSAVYIKESLRLPKIDSLCVLLAMFKNKKSILNQIFVENGIGIIIDTCIDELLNSKEYYEKVTGNQYPLDVAKEENLSKEETASVKKEELTSNEESLEGALSIVFYQSSVTYDYFPYYSDDLKEAMVDSGMRCRVCGQNYIDEENLLYSLLNGKENSSKIFLEDIFNSILDNMDIRFDMIDLIDCLLSNQTIYFDTGEKTVMIPKPLENCCTVLNDKYNKGDICDILNRDTEIFDVWSILSKHQKSNVILLGEAGVGKSAIVEALAMSIVNETCPKKFVGYTIVELNISGMVAGTKYRGEFEKKVEYLIKFINQYEKLILFVDEVHQMVGAGSSENGGPDLSGALKPILAREKIKFIGATTLKEYQTYICRDNAFRRRLEPVIIEEPKFDQVLPMLSVKIENLKKVHQVTIEPNELDYVKLCSLCFHTSTCNPDKTLDLLDRSMAIASMEKERKVKREHIERVFVKNYTEFSNLIEDMKQAIAYHELGHFAANMEYKETLVDERVLVISIIPGFDFLGANFLEGTNQLPYSTRNYMEAKIISLLAGRISEKRISGAYSSGGSNDLKRANEIARKMVMQYGLMENDYFSRNYLENSKENSLLPISQDEINNINKAVSEIILIADQKAKEIIEKHWHVIEKSANKLLEKKIVLAEEFENLFV